MRRQDIDNAKRIDDCSKQAKEKANTCLHPGCNKKAINSHIMQKNGILSSISEDNHLWESSIDHFTEELFVFNKNHKIPPFICIKLGYVFLDIIFVAYLCLGYIARRVEVFQLCISVCTF